MTHVGVSLVFGLIVAAMIYATGHLSGAHLNPAVTLGFVLARHFSARRMAGYWLAQLAGPTVGAARCVCCWEIRRILGLRSRLEQAGPGSPWGWKVCSRFS